MRLIPPTLICLLLVLNSIYGVNIIQDDVDNSDGWQIITGGSFSSNYGLLNPECGIHFFRAQTSGSGNRGAAKYFTNTFATGRYLLEFKIGNQDGISFDNDVGIMLMADTNNDGLYSYSERIISGRLILTEDTPTTNTWSTWQIRYIIDENTTTANGDPVLGKPIGCYTLAYLNNSGYCFDDLSVDFEPLLSGINDPVESNDGWTAITGGSFSSSTYGLSPTEGSSFFYALTSGSGNRGVWKYFDADLIYAQGNYSIQFDVGRMNGIEFINNTSFLLMADTNRDGLYQWNERIINDRVVVSEPEPNEGEWVQWKYEYNITENTVNADNIPVIGYPIGFIFLSNLNNNGYSIDQFELSKSNWNVASPGGGGAFRSPSISPHDSNLMFCSNDMGSAFRSRDGGVSWTMIPHKMLHSTYSTGSYPQHVWAFHPDDPKLIHVSTNTGFYYSEDAGESFSNVNLDGISGQTRGPRVVAFDPNDSDIGVSAYNDGEAFTYNTLILTSNGSDWDDLYTVTGSDEDIVNVGFTQPVGSSTVILMATSSNIYKGTQSGGIWSWTTAENGLPSSGLNIYDMVCSGDRAYLTCEESTANIGIFTTTDGGTSWSRVTGNGLYTAATTDNQYKRLAVCDADNDTVIVSYSGTSNISPTEGGESNIFLSTDAGTNWRTILFQHSEMADYNIENTSWLSDEWGWNNPSFSIDISPANPNVMAVSTITSVYTTSDGGTEWQQRHAANGTVSAQPAGGMPMLSVWNYYFSPEDSRKRYLATTDFGGWSSIDAGATWRYNYEGNTWFHNIYAIAMSPSTPDRIWTACSNTHDIPTWKYQDGIGTYVGGIALSEDGGETWTTTGVNTGLPTRAVTDIWIDPAHVNYEEEHLWAAIPGHGIYFSNNGGQSWSTRNSGINTNNLNVIRIKGVGSTLYAMTTVKYPSGGGRISGALYKSTDSGSTWTEIFYEPGDPFLTEFIIDPNNSSVLYVCGVQTQASTTSPGGGIWRSDDGGSTWIQIHDEPTYSLTVTPNNSSKLIISSWEDLGDGLYMSTDTGNTWESIDSYPHWRPLKIVFHPNDDDLIFVTNFGGGVFQTRLSSIE
ncbi:hypothetical protein QEH59_06455 [Coraliomargarita sp. SDUM461004]|uniref:Sortilin N-terminal domain-containing protein n=1 Tax=Thalassobacterium sedimentorum TaxID=3041258 RepID=A0ABU1AGV8_9BACT|nr:hypothetical protein [Coraliomargarita sp. SDUM461004]MDQ8194057.1 hypothetical protein [Coraliomargarita sp. SDUM461004]